MGRLHIKVQGVVQGVGFRPTVYRLALQHGLSGWVRNQPDGVVIEVQGGEAATAAFVLALKKEVPRPARVRSVEFEVIPEIGDPGGFEITKSDGSADALPVVPPDLAVCPDCSREMDQPGERRHRYPFTNCTYCGPRYTLIEGLPYDRSRTSMKGFDLCAECEREYLDPLDRRFHAQPVACPVCGPRLSLQDGEGAALAEGEAALQGAVAALLRGEVLAMKGLGGYQLLVDATSESAVQLLRERKRREEKPFAVMFPDLATLHRSCAGGEAEAEWLLSPEAPILLLRRTRDASVVPGVAPGNPRLGAILPYTPLHRLLLAGVARPLVCTSGNLSDEPMAFRDDEARRRLSRLADLFLVHDRPIVRPVDDSVLRLDRDGPTLLRRARGYAPLSVPVASAGPPVLALGAHQKNTVSLLFGGQLVMSQHLGDLSSLEGAELLERTVEDLTGFFGVRPEVLACDLHPDYASTRLAERLARTWGAPLVRVQHHHAHGAACVAEHGLRGPVLALAWDGTGLGTDGSIWGGEALLLEGAGFRRVGHLKPFPLPGGDAAVKEPRRSACGLLWATLGPSAMPEELRTAFSEGELPLLQSMLARDLNSPLTSSMGRLFDALAALTGLRTRRGFEGQAAMALEYAAGHVGPEPAYSWSMQGGEILVADPTPVVESLLLERAAGQPADRLARRFHESLADLALAWARHAAVPDVVLAGGCFQNALLTALVTKRLSGSGFRVHRHRLFPPNDGSISLGQAAVAGVG